jgi:predicted Co/Zn/Cd cation transporter (cation efflux family)
MPRIVGLPFSLAVVAGIILLVGVLSTVMLFTFAGAGVYSLLALALPAVAYTVCFAIGKKYGEFYAYSMGKKPVQRVKTMAWLHTIYEDFSMKLLLKKYGG